MERKGGRKEKDRERERERVSCHDLPLKSLQSSYTNFRINTKQANGGDQSHALQPAAAAAPGLVIRIRLKLSDPNPDPCFSRRDRIQIQLQI